MQLICANVDGVFALEKPAGVICHPNWKGISTNSLLLLNYDLNKQAYVEPGGIFFYLLNRIDAATSGIVILSDNFQTANAIRESFRQRLVKKTYFSYNKGSDFGEKTWNDFLVKEKENEKNLRVRQKINPNSRKAVTEVKKILQFSISGIPITLLKLNPKTGITHQLRAQSAQRNLPIINDKIYGDFRFNRFFRQKTGIKEMLLQAAFIEIPYNFNGKSALFSATSPSLDKFFNLMSNVKILMGGKLIQCSAKGTFPASIADNDTNAG